MTFLVTGKGVKSTTSKPNLDVDDEAFLRAILHGNAKLQPLQGDENKNDAALLAAFLKDQGITPSTPANSLREQLQQAVSYTILSFDTFVFSLSLSHSLLSLFFSLFFSRPCTLEFIFTGNYVVFFAKSRPRSSFERSIFFN